METSKQRKHTQIDERLAELDPERLNMLLAFADQLANAPQDQKLNTFLSINRAITQKQINFSPTERDLLLEVLTEHMSPEEKKRIEVIQNLAHNLHSGQK